MLLSRTQRKTWGKRTDLGTQISQWAQAFSSLPSLLRVNVVLVGFDGHGSGNAVVSESDLQRHLEAIKATLSSVVLQPEIEDLVRMSYVLRICR
jgi:hypothetical protein